MAISAKGLPYTAACRHLQVAGEVRRMHVLLRGAHILNEGKPVRDPGPARRGRMAASG